MKTFFTDNQRKVISEAIIDHRASLEYEPRSDYGKIVSSADRNIDTAILLKRLHAYTLKHFPNLNLEQMIDRAYDFTLKKFGTEGYAKSYCIDKSYENYKKKIVELLKNKNEFSKDT